VRERRLPGVLFLYFGFTVLQPALFVFVGALHHLNPRGIWFIVVLLLALAFRSRVAWVLLIVVNAIPLLAVGAAVGSEVQWGHLAVMVLTGVALEATLLSAAMRQHVRGAGNGANMPVPSL
jgi:hypothetical protein